MKIILFTVGTINDYGGVNYDIQSRWAANPKVYSPRSPDRTREVTFTGQKCPLRDRRKFSYGHRLDWNPAQPFKSGREGTAAMKLMSVTSAEPSGNLIFRNPPVDPVWNPVLNILGKMRGFFKS